MDWAFKSFFLVGGTQVNSKGEEAGVDREGLTLLGKLVRYKRKEGRIG
jgi:hypothetical protein